jgi:hypothetical protein
MSLLQTVSLLDIMTTALLISHLVAAAAIFDYLHNMQKLQFLFSLEPFLIRGS